MQEQNPRALEFDDISKFKEDKEFADFLFRETGFRNLGDYFELLRSEEGRIEHPGADKSASLS